MRKILIVILILYTYLGFGQIPLMVNNKFNYDINCILENKYDSYRDTCVATYNKFKSHWKKKYYLNANDFKIKVLPYIYIKNKDIKIDSTTNLMNEIIVDTISIPYQIQFYKYNKLWGVINFSHNQLLFVDIVEGIEEEPNINCGLWCDLYRFKPDYEYYMKDDDNGDSIVLLKDNNLYYYEYRPGFLFKDKFEPLYKYLMNHKKVEEEEIKGAIIIK